MGSLRRESSPGGWGLTPKQGFRVAAVPVGEKAGGGARSQSRNRLFLPQKGAGEDEVSALSKRSRGFSPALEPGEGGLGPAGSRPHQEHTKPVLPPPNSPFFYPKRAPFFIREGNEARQGETSRDGPRKWQKFSLGSGNPKDSPFFPPRLSLSFIFCFKNGEKQSDFRQIWAKK